MPPGDKTYSGIRAAWHPRQNRVGGLDTGQGAMAGTATASPTRPMSTMTSALAFRWAAAAPPRSLDPANVVALMGEERAAMVFSDPPFNVPIDGHVSGLGAIRHRPFPMASGEMDKASFTA